ncbi:MAG: hypothetical protein RLZZ546_1021 [Bacteroidota bacterium]|jgi:ABC-type multidrug transport system fused ATPase/permease subunit
MTFSPLLTQIWKENKGKVIVTNLLNFFENTCWLSIPATSGMMVNSFINKEGNGFYYFLLSYIGWHFIATVRRIYDTKVYTSIYNQISLQTILSHKEKSIDPGKINARIELLKQMVYFFENDLPFLLNSLVQMIGAALMLFVFDKKVMFVCFIVLIPSFIINYFFGKRMKAITVKVNNEYEKQYDKILEEDEIGLKKYFSNVRLLNINKSNQEAYNFVFLEAFVLIMIVSSLYLICQNPNLDYGKTLAIYGYITKFAYSFDFIPHITAKLALVKDIDERLAFDE